MNYHPSTKAERRAWALLLKHLTEEQRNELAGSGRFTHWGSYQWTIDLSGSGPRAWLRADGDLVCVRTSNRRTGIELPRADQALAYLLALRADEAGMACTVNAMAFWPVYY